MLRSFDLEESPELCFVETIALAGQRWVATASVVVAKALGSVFRHRQHQVGDGVAQLLVLFSIEMNAVDGTGLDDASSIQECGAMSFGNILIELIEFERFLAPPLNIDCRLPVSRIGGGATTRVLNG